MDVVEDPQGQIDVEVNGNNNNEMTRNGRISQVSWVAQCLYRSTSILPARRCLLAPMSDKGTEARSQSEPVVLSDRYV
jgi:hypothetical protein